MPDVILGPPIGRGPEGGSMDVLSLGNEGSIILEFDDLGVVDGEGPDLIVFENAFPSWTETGVVAASEDGVTWHEWPCAATGDEVGCAGLNPVLSNPKNGIEPTDPDAAGGDAYDLADIGIARARFVRIRDSGANTYDGTSGGFDLDAVAVVNWQPIGEW